MAGEGVFPKTAGDVAYASEANFSRGAGFAPGAGTFNFIGSRTDNVIGSVLIPAGSIPNPGEIKILALGKRTQDADSLGFEISGASANQSVSTGSNVAAGGGAPMWLVMHAVVGSPMSGLMVIQGGRATGDNWNPGGNSSMAGNAISNLDTSSAIVIKFLGVPFTSNGSFFIESYSVRTGGPI